MKMWPRKRFLGAELAVGVAVTCALALWMERYGGTSAVDLLLKDNRAQVYSALASIFGSLLGFVIATMAIVVAFEGLPRLRLVRESATYPILWRIFTSAIRWLGGATIGALAALVLDHGDTLGRMTLYVCVGTTLIAILRVVRCVWVMEQLIRIIVKRGGGTTRANAAA